MRETVPHYVASCQPPEERETRVPQVPSSKTTERRHRDIVIPSERRYAPRNRRTPRAARSPQYLRAGSRLSASTHHAERPRPVKGRVARDSSLIGASRSAADLAWHRAVRWQWCDSGREERDKRRGPGRRHGRARPTIRFFRRLESLSCAALPRTVKTAPGTMCCPAPDRHYAPLDDGSEATTSSLSRRMALSTGSARDTVADVVRGRSCMGRWPGRHTASLRQSESVCKRGQRGLPQRVAGPY
ncbi:hypothetical protein FOMPIDRAFT_1049792 [Fomitopsis schrenkii]|uniref:Uncharacterized protein n=1 Tax=Fomitopsis schrenkii TaxID=2126942 RepID=S8FQ80_FOMSC|nr:hypothetical protein FOMPIDRAFT_1049792 [Fomitopsis schrenkii]